MELSQEDRKALFSLWMSQKAKMHLTQMEMARRLGISQIEFSNIIRGNASVSMPFVNEFCKHLHVDPYTFLPSLLVERKDHTCLTLTNTVTVDGDIQQVRVDGNQVIIEYQHRV